MNILLVEPDRLLGEMYREALAGQGEVAWARSAEAAVQAADQDAPDIVLLEPRLARHNGVEFLYEFKSYPEWRKVPVVLLSNSHLLHISPQALADLGVVKILDKRGASLKEICLVVDSVVRARQTRE